MTRAAAILVAFVLLAGGAGAAFFVLRRSRGPSSGVELVYSCATDAAERDARAIGARLADADAYASVEVLDPRHLRLRAAGDPSSVELARSVTITHALEIAPVDEEAMRAAVALPAGVTLAEQPPTLVAANDAMLAAVAVPAGARLASDCRVGACRAWIVAAAELTDADIADARAVAEPDPMIAITLTESGRARFAALTSRSVHRRVAVLLDGHALMVPVVEEPITGGEVRVTMGAGGTLAEADADARALRRGRLACPSWTLESEAVFGH